jgi:hypothetical protein
MALALSCSIRNKSQYKGVKVDCGYRVDLLVEDKLIISGGVVSGTGYYTPQVEECGADQRHSRGLVVDLHETGGSEDWTPDELQCRQAYKWDQALCSLRPSCSSCLPVLRTQTGPSWRNSFVP